MSTSPIGILLAAGRGRRFDPQGLRNKLLQRLPDSGEPVVVASARKLLAAVPAVVAVVAPDDGGVGALLAGLGCQVTVCPDADSGMAASLTHAIRYSLEAPAEPIGWLVALGDMPFVEPATLAALRDAIAAGAGIAAPVLDGRCGDGRRGNGRRGNPVAFGRTHLPALLALQGDQGARRLLQTCAVTDIAVPDTGILRDVDTPADLAP